MITEKTKEKSYHHGDLRAALLEAAETELLESGVEGFSLRKVARRAGVSHAAPAHHFGDVKGLLTALATRGFERLLELREMRRQSARPNAQSELMAYGLAYCDFARDHMALFRLCFASQKPDPEDALLQQAGDRAYHRLGQDIAAVTGRRFGEDPAAEMDTVAVWSMTHGLADLMAQGRFQEMQGMVPEDRDTFIMAMLSRSFPRATPAEGHHVAGQPRAGS